MTNPWIVTRWARSELTDKVSRQYQIKEHISTYHRLSSKSGKIPTANWKTRSFLPNIKPPSENQFHHETSNPATVLRPHTASPPQSKSPARDNNSIVPPTATDQHNQPQHSFQLNNPHHQTRKPVHPSAVSGSPSHITHKESKQSLGSQQIEPTQIKSPHNPSPSPINQTHHKPCPPPNPPS